MKDWKPMLTGCKNAVNLKELVLWMQTTFGRGLENIHLSSYLYT